MSVLELPLLVDLQQKVGKLVPSTTSRPSISILDNTLNWCIENVVTVILTTGIMFLLFTCMYFWVCCILRWLSACAPTAYEVVHDCEKFEKLR
jgi:hypothetical protein